MDNAVKHPFRMPIALGLIGAAAMMVLGSTGLGDRVARAQEVAGVVLRSHRVTVNIQDQIATTTIEQVFFNNGGGLGESEYIFPLPAGAAVTDLTLYINGEPVRADLLGKDRAQGIYDAIVRSRRDPALLKYIGRDAIQANVFPIPAGEERRVLITYSQALTAENGLYRYAYALKTDYLNKLVAQSVSVAAIVRTSREIGTAYSPNPGVLVQQISEDEVRAGYESTTGPASDFELYFSLPTGGETGEVNADLVTYRAGANEDGYFMLLLSPPFRPDARRVLPRDVILVLDQSGSMTGPKWDQATAAIKDVLGRLNPEDRFNVVVFSSAYRVYANELQPAANAGQAISWIDTLEPIGGTNISDALATAASLRDPARPTTILFLTDGIPTEGITDSKAILADFASKVGTNVQLFTFGVGDDVDTFLLDSLSSTYSGVSTYVRPNEDVKTQVAALYSKINAPILRNLQLKVEGVLLEELIPSGKLPDLFIGNQLVIVGRYRNGTTGTVTLTGDLSDGPQSFTFNNLNFPEVAGGQPFVARLWAQRRIGALLNQIRLNGENPELVQSVVTLSIRYGILTPYTAYLAIEPGMQPPIVEGDMPAPPIVPLPIDQGAQPSGVPANNSSASGADAVNAAERSNELAGGNAIQLAPTAIAQSGAMMPGNTAPPTEVIKQVADRAFVYRNGIWVDTTYTDSTLKPVVITFLSDAYFELLKNNPGIAEYLSIGDHILLMINGVLYEIKP